VPLYPRLKIATHPFENLDPLRANALARLDQWAGEQAINLTSPPIALIRARKAAEADLVLAGANNASAAPLLAPEAAARGVTLQDLAAIVSERSATANAALATIEVERQARQARIRSATHPAAIDAVLADLPRIA
jgi:hypothetical protein